MPYTSERVRSRHPFELFFVGFTLLVSVGGFFNHASRPGSVQDAVGTTGTLIWYAALLLGALAALAGIFWRERATGLMLEALGLLTSGLATIFYGVTAMILLGEVATYSAGIMFGYGGAALWRSAQIRHLLVTVAREHTGNRGE